MKTKSAKSRSRPKQYSVEAVRRRVSAQFREAARQIAESHDWGCSAVHRVGGFPLLNLFEGQMFPLEHRHAVGAFWLGSARLGDGTLPEVNDVTKYPTQMRRVVGLLLCAEAARDLTRAELRRAGYRVD